VPPVPILKPDEVVEAFERLGWEIARQCGSHIILTKEGHMATLSVPKHPDVARGTLRSLIARAGLTIEEFLEALAK
jgi:predicted RNA binding protein YcfA (HicA-like mRNA interferase family)